MSDRRITFTFGDITLSAGNYSITSKDKLMQLALANGIIRTVTVGKAAGQIKITGQLPASESRQLFKALEPLVGSGGKRLLLDGAEYESVTLDVCTVNPSKIECFAQFTLEFHF